MTEKPFLKNDAGKPMMIHLPWEIIEIVAKVERHGAEKYAPDNWKNGTPETYLNAAQRHLSKRYQGEHSDESGFPHIAMAICDLIYALWLDLRPKPKAKISVGWAEPSDSRKGWVD